MQGSQTSLPEFTETHYVPTDDLGQVTLVIGQGTTTEGMFSELDWSLGSYYLSIELDTGSGYVAMGTTQLLSVPYALYAENANINYDSIATILSNDSSKCCCTVFAEFVPPRFVHGVRSHALILK